VVCLRVEQPVDDLLALLAASDHQGFPVESDGSFVGLVLRQHLYALLAGGQFSRAAAPADAAAAAPDAADGAPAPAREAAAAAQRRSATSENYRLSSDDRLGPPNYPRSSGLSVFHSNSILYGCFVWASRALNSQKRRFPAPGSGAADVPRGAGGGVRRG
jgi:hypothetical protein